MVQTSDEQATWCSIHARRDARAERYPSTNIVGKMLKHQVVKYADIKINIVWSDLLGDPQIIRPQRAATNSPTTRHARCREGPRRLPSSTYPLNPAEGKVRRSRAETGDVPRVEAVQSAQRSDRKMQARFTYVCSLTVRDTFYAQCRCGVRFAQSSTRSRTSV